MEKVVIAAMSENRVIGKDGEIPWHYSEDMKFFRENTMGFPVVMGSNTYRSLPEDFRPLEGRKNIVLTSSGLDLDEDFVEASSLEEAFEEAEDTGKDKVFIAGGGSVYNQTLDLADRLLLTVVKEEVEGDTYFPEFDTDEWEKKVIRETGELRFEQYEKDGEP